MPYQILAGVCHHPIRISDHLPWSGSQYDFAQPYCGHCASSRSIRQERDQAEQIYNERRVDRDHGRTDRSTYRAARREWDNARLRCNDDLEAQQERQDRERRAQGRPTLREEARRFAGLDDPEWIAFRQQMNGTDRTTRFAEPERHRRESRYRPQAQYRRSSRAYLPGSHSSRREYWDTSNDVYEDNDADLDRLDDRQLDQRYHSLQAQLSRFRR